MSRMLFSESYNIMVKKVSFVGSRGSDRPNRPPPGSTPAEIVFKAIFLETIEFLRLSRIF